MLLPNFFARAPERLEPIGLSAIETPYDRPADRRRPA